MTLTQSLGLAHSVRPRNVWTLASSAALSISFLVFLNTIQPFFLSTVLGVPSDILGSITGNLILADELLSLVLVVVWGSVADQIGVRWVVVGGHLLVSLGLTLYSVSHSAYPAVLLSRMVFATGASGLVLSLGAALAGMVHVPTRTATTASASSVFPQNSPRPRIAITQPSASSSFTGPVRSLSERTLLLDDGEEVGTPDAMEQSNKMDEAVQIDPKQSAKLAGFLGFSTGCGALLGVFVFFRLPAAFSDLSPANAIRATFIIVASIALLEGCFSVYGLKRRSTVSEPVSAVEEESRPVGWGAKMKELASELLTGFRFAGQDSKIALALVSAFATRAQSVAVTAFIPLFINQYFLSHGCASPCHRASVLSASLTGSIQLLSLLLSPLVGILTSRISSPLTLALSSSMGVVAFLVFAFLPQGDPTLLRVWWAGCLMGASQIGGIVVGLTLVAEGRGEIMERDDKEGNAKEVGGAISGVYSASGGLGILILGKLGGSLFDRWHGAPFLLIAIVDLGATASALLVYWRTARQGRVAL